MSWHSRANCSRAVAIACLSAVERPVECGVLQFNPAAPAIDQARIVAQHRRYKPPVLGQVAAQQAVRDIVERVEPAADLEAGTLEERLYFAQAGGELQLGNVAQDAGVEDVHPERGLRRNADPLRVELLEVGEARGKPPALP